MNLRPLLALLCLSLPLSAVAHEVPVSDFFRKAEFESVELSPDGKHLSIIVPQDDRTILAVIDVATKKVVGKWDYGENRHFSDVTWVNDNRLLFRVGIKLGSLDYQVSKGDLYASNIDGTGRIDIPNGAYYSIVDTTPDDPDTILVQRSVENSFLFKLNVNNGRVVTVASAPVDYGNFVLDHALNVRYVVGQNKDGSEVAYRRDGDKWTLVHTSKEEDETYRPLGMSADDKHVLLLRGIKGKPEGLYSLDPETGEQTLVASNPVVDPSSLIVASDRRTLLAVGFEDGKPSWDFIEPEHPESKIYQGLIDAFPSKALTFSGSSDGGRFIAFTAYSDTSPGEAYLYDTKTGKATYLLSAEDWIKPDEMSPMQPIQITTRDGATVYGYLTVPKGSNGKNLPLIVHPHGGPHGIRDDWGYQPAVQLMANRGYAVLQLNYRGSGGYGRAYEQAGYRKWGTLMQDDLTDAVKSLQRQGVVDPKRVCIFGGSYGGYAALMSIEREPDLYQCSVGYAGVYDLDIQRSKSDTSESDIGMAYLNRVYPTSDAERRAQSPAYNVDKIKAAVALVHGGKDVRVPIANMHLLIEKMAEVGKKPEFVMVEPKEPHGFQQPEHNIALYEKLIAFFDRHIGPQAGTANAGK